MKILPRFIRFRAAPTYLGMDRNRFNAEVREVMVAKDGIEPPTQGFSVRTWLTQWL